MAAKSLDSQNVRGGGGGNRRYIYMNGTKKSRHRVLFEVQCKKEAAGMSTIKAVLYTVTSLALLRRFCMDSQPRSSVIGLGLLV